MTYTCYKALDTNCWWWEMNIMGTKESCWWCTIMAYVQAIKIESKLKIKTPIHLNNKGNEVIAWCLFGVGSCLFLNRNCHCMCCHHQCLLHHICANQVINDNVHQSTNPSLVIRISIHRQMWWGKRWDTSFWTCAPLSKAKVATVS